MTLKVVAISDTHCSYPELPAGDLFIHAGDWTYMGERARKSEVSPNHVWLAREAHKFKKMIGVAGNHDFGFHRNTFYHCQLLFNEEIEFEGKRIYGTPMVPTYGDWAFMASETNLYVDYYSQIPEGLDILVLHGPPRGYLDTNMRGNRCGSWALAKRLHEMEQPPKNVLFGHIHRDWNSLANPMIDSVGPNRQVVNFYNVSYLDESYAEGFNGITEIYI